jgi:adenylylsulfate kinase-like enzyme
VIVAAISPYRKDRQLARDKVPADRFIEIHVDTPIELCEQRDPKGLYQKARAGEIRGFTGIDAPYESPTSPELRLTPDAGDPPALANQVIEALQNRALIVEHCPKDLS